MPEETDIIISELTNAPQIDDTAVFPLTQDNGGSPATFKASMSEIAGKVAEGTTFVNLETTAKNLVGAINELAEGGGGSADIISTASGTIATFSDGGDNIPVKSLVTEITATQAGTGTPSPDNVRAITGVDSVDVEVIGKNHYSVKVGRDLFADNRGASHTTNSDILSITMDSQNNSGVYGGTGTAVNNIICQTIKKYSGLYVLSLYAKANSDNKDVYFGFQSFASTVETLTTEWKRIELPLTLDNAIHTLNIYNRSSSAITVDVKDVQIELGSTATDYAEYNSKSAEYSITLPETIYGGNASLTDGTGVKDYGYIEFDGSEDEDWSYSTGNKWATITISDMKSGANQDGIANWLPKSTSYGTFGFALGRNNNNFYAYQIIDISGVTDLASWKTYLSTHPLQVKYPLAQAGAISFSPVKIPTLAGLNNIFSSTGDVEVEYFNENADQTAELIRVMTR